MKLLYGVLFALALPSLASAASIGNVYATGSPTTGLAQWNSATSVTQGDLSGDCTTSGLLAITCTKSGGTLLTSLFAPIASPTFTGIATSPQFSVAGNITAASWTTAGLALTGTAATFTDSTASGTVTTEAAYALPVATIASTNASVTITNLTELYLPAPVNGTNVTGTNKYSLFTAGGIRNAGIITSTAGATFQGGAINLNASSNFGVNVGTGTTNVAVTIGGTSNTVAMPGLTTGTNADTVCATSGLVLLIQAAACTISSKRFKEDINKFTGDALADVMRLPTYTFRMKKEKPANPDPNARSLQVGLIAEDVAKIMPQCALYERDMKTPKSYRQECVIAELVKAVQQQQVEIAALQRRH